MIATHILFQLLLGLVFVSNYYCQAATAAELNDENTISMLRQQRHRLNQAVRKEQRKLQLTQVDAVLSDALPSNLFTIPAYNSTDEDPTIQLFQFTNGNIPIGTAVTCTLTCTSNNGNSERIFVKEGLMPVNRLDASDFLFGNCSLILPYTMNATNNFYAFAFSINQALVDARVTCIANPPIPTPPPPTPGPPTPAPPTPTPPNPTAVAPTPTAPSAPTTTATSSPTPSPTCCHFCQAKQVFRNGVTKLLNMLSLPG